MIPIPNLVRQQWSRHRNRVKLVIRYLTGQGILQILNVLNGFFLLRWLSIDEQAKFSVAMALQATLGLLGDLGFGGSLIGLIGNQTDDKITIGQYIKGIQYFKNRFLLVSIIIGSSLAFVYYQRHGWSYDFAAIFGLLLISVYAQSESGYYAALLQIKRNLIDFYRPQIASAATRLLISALLFNWAGLNALLVVMLTTLVLTVNAVWIKRQAKIYYVPAQQVLPTVRRKIGQTLLPVAPLVFFYATQGQLTTFLIGYFGKNQSIAEMGALGRLGQLFVLLGPFNTVVLMPFFARSAPAHLVGRFVGVVGIGILLIIPLCFLAWVAPDAYLLLLGQKYSTVRNNIFLYVCTASIGYLGSLVWVINVSRNWNRWYMTALSMTTTVFVQFYFILEQDLSTTKQVLTLGFIVSVVAFINASINAFIGLTQFKTANSATYKVQSTS